MMMEVGKLEVGKEYIDTDGDFVTILARCPYTPEKYVGVWADKDAEDGVRFGMYDIRGNRLRDGMSSIDWAASEGHESE